MLVNGRWTDAWQPEQQADTDGRFVRQESSFRHRISADEGFAPEAGRYHLYVGYICPWASRTLIARGLKGLEAAIGVSVVDPRLGAEGWEFTGALGSDRDLVNGSRYVHELYTRAEPQYSGRATIPVLWDTRRRTIVNNESADILSILNRDFGALAAVDMDLQPAAWRDDIAAGCSRSPLSRPAYGRITSRPATIRSRP